MMFIDKASELTITIGNGCRNPAQDPFNIMGMLYN